MNSYIFYQRLRLTLGKAHLSRQNAENVKKSICASVWEIYYLWKLMYLFAVRLISVNLLNHCFIACNKFTVRVRSALQFVCSCQVYFVSFTGHLTFKIKSVFPAGSRVLNILIDITAVMSIRSLD